MKRQWNIQVEETGTPEAQAAGAALGLIAGPEFIRSIIDTYTLLSRYGGEFYCGAYRDKYRETVATDEEGTPYVDEFGNPVKELQKVIGDEPGDWYTTAFLFHAESVAKATRVVTGAEEEKQAKLNQARPLAPAQPSHAEADREQLEAVEAAA